MSNGAKQSLFNVFQAIIDSGDEVIIPAPFWVTYPELVTYSGGRNVFIPTTASTQFKLTPETLRKHITKKTKALVLTTPSNPTGMIYSRSDLEALAEVLKGSDIIVIADEIYEKLIYEGEFVSVGAINSDMFERTITINGLSKSVAGQQPVGEVVLVFGENRVMPDFLHDTLFFFDEGRGLAILLKGPLSDFPAVQVYHFVEVHIVEAVTVYHLDDRAVLKGVSVVVVVGLDFIAIAEVHFIGFQKPGNRVKRQNLVPLFYLVYPLLCAVVHGDERVTGQADIIGSASKLCFNTLLPRGTGHSSFNSTTISAIMSLKPTSISTRSYRSRCVLNPCWAII